MIVESNFEVAMNGDRCHPQFQELIGSRVRMALCVFFMDFDRCVSYQGEVN